MTHREEKIEMYCRAVNCKIGVCNKCIESHSNHDLIKADEMAAFEVRNELDVVTKEWK